MTSAGGLLGAGVVGVGQGRGGNKGGWGWGGVPYLQGVEVHLQEAGLPLRLLVRRRAGARPPAATAVVLVIQQSRCPGGLYPPSSQRLQLLLDVPLPVGTTVWSEC